MTDDGRVFLTNEQAIAMLPDGDYIHTFRQTVSGVILGVNRERGEILAAIAKFKPELSGDVAASIGHGLVIEDGRGFIFIETRRVTNEVAKERVMDKQPDAIKYERFAAVAQLPVWKIGILGLVQAYNLQAAAQVAIEHGEEGVMFALRIAVECGAVEAINKLSNDLETESLQRWQRIGNDDE